jgi:hypothetical protein
MNILQQAVRRLERLEALDKVAKPLAGAVGRAVRPRVVRNLLSGTDLGDPRLPMLTDLPIGAWVMSALPDVAGAGKTYAMLRDAMRCAATTTTWWSPSNLLRIGLSEYKMREFECWRRNPVRPLRTTLEPRFRI